ncbi:hypothetical protein CEUSTIGMA_g510.t1 [Chlamydomonas eustigma]|uniref:Kinesin-like protein n=1 Tax=Chlamydomonas eustigma TaxID=1157962 RepID=A0A250WQD6_9CHLO|nr:hypothetical protein CEUSTIGMA_g510.t1 [Chlamydomonas eustigma]|eukprot:GAX73057.1 hypothetical protein CEUSTIGMA_g510.t1 [Chlamydomonas eustigma]
MAETESGENAIQVCVRVRPLNNRERDEGHRTCVVLDEETKQVVLTAVDKNTLLQLRGSSAKGYAFDRRYDQNDISDMIYDDCIAQLVEKVFKGYNGTVMAYGQTGSGKTHTMSGGAGIHGKVEEGITPRVIRHVFSVVDSLNKRAKVGEKVEISAYALELYNEDLLDLSSKSGRAEELSKGWDASKGAAGGLKLTERPVGKDGRVVPEVIGVKEMKCETADDLKKFYDECMENRSTTSTKLNDRSSRSHAIFTVNVHRTMVDVLNEVGDDMKARVRTSEFTSKLHLVDLAGSERVKRSGVVGKELKEAANINGGLLVLGNVIVALSSEADGKKKGHVPYRDSKLTRLLQDSLGGNSLTVLISCISPSESDFEETNNTLKYANRACHIKNTPLPNKFTMLEEDLLPSLPMAGAGGLGMMQLQALLEDHERLKENHEKKAREKAEKEALRLAALQAMKDEEVKKPGFQRLRSSQYDVLRRQLASGGTNIPSSQVIGDDTLKGFGRMRMSQTVDSPGVAAGTASATPPVRRSRRVPGRKQAGGRGTSSTKSASKPAGSTFQDWLQSQMGEEGSASAPNGSQASGETYQEGMEEEEDDLYEQHYGAEGEDGDFIVEDDDESAYNPIVEDEDGGLPIVEDGELGEAGLIEDEEGAAVATHAVEEAAGKSKFRRGAVARATIESDSVLVESPRVEENEVVVEEEEAYDPIEDNATPKLLARFRVNQNDVLAVFKAISKEDFQDVVGLLPQGTPLPASDKMTYLLARLESGSGNADLQASLQRVASGQTSMNSAVGPAVGCLMATFGTNMISSCIFEFEDPEDLVYYGVEERIELWGLQIPHNSARPQLEEVASKGEDQGGEDKAGKADNIITWTSVDRLNMSIGLLYALSNLATDQNISCGFCVPRPQLLKRWLQAGVKMKQITSTLKLIYPPSAHDYEYYKASTVAYFMIDEVKEALRKVLSVVE